MTRLDTERSHRAPAVALAVGLLAFVVASLASSGSSQAQASGVSGEAYGHYTKVGLFGGPLGQVGPAPRVILPSAGADAPLTAAEPDGASAVYGPAHIFGGRWPIKLGIAPQSGPISVSTKGTPGPGASVTSSVDITLFPKPVPTTCDGEAPETKNCTVPGGFGPVVPNEGDELHATCTANDKGATGSTRLVNAVISPQTDESGEPKGQEPLPENPPVNYTRTGVITNVGDKWKIVYNEQIVDPDGSITVNAIHMYLLGDIAVGEQILGHVRCSMHAAETSATTLLPASGAPPSAPASGPAETPIVPTVATTSTSGTTLPLALSGAGAAVLAAGLGGAFLWMRKRRGAGDPAAADGAPSTEPPVA